MDLVEYCGKVLSSITFLPKKLGSETSRHTKLCVGTNSSTKNSLKLYEIRNNSELKLRLTEPHPEPVSCLCHIPRSSLVVSGSNTGVVRSYQFHHCSSVSLRNEDKLHKTGVTSIIANEITQDLATSSEDGQIMGYDLQRGTIKQILQCGSITDLAFSGANSLLSTGSSILGLDLRDPKEKVVFNKRNNKMSKKTINQSNRYSYSVCTQLKNPYNFAVGFEKQIKFFDWRSPFSYYKIELHKSQIWKIIGDKQQNVLYSAGEDGKIFRISLSRRKKIKKEKVQDRSMTRQLQEEINFEKDDDLESESETDQDLEYNLDSNSGSGSGSDPESDLDDNLGTYANNKSTFSSNQSEKSYLNQTIAKRAEKIMKQFLGVNDLSIFENYLAGVSDSENLFVINK
ncbi:nucleoporin nup43 [Anaeramoeba flamelloides]|uniref:Nucleoporin nup43 n=1 Tax=Anaeramoeba flamelloides TaxID=1746091 RepID=A0AAV8AB35_9EUKA|nr:nucleoporin nup43 [Anaeramoeba flamelloides]